MSQHNPRYALAAARIALRAAQDSETTLKAIITMQAQGSNETQRKGHTAELLLHSDDYQDALRELRTCEAALDHAQAAVDMASDEAKARRDQVIDRLAMAFEQLAVAHPVLAAAASLTDHEDHWR